MWNETTRFLIISLIFHLLYTYSIFDIYFTSPVVHPNRRFSAANALDQAGNLNQTYEGPAKRLVLIVGDGLRADTLYKYHDSSMLPPWAQDDVLRYGKVQTSTALDTKKSWSSDGVKSSVSTSFDAAPYLRQIALQRGAWGLSHTRVPTESRPGHVALIAGMYEDVSAVTKGWKLNPVPFDSVFNQSSHTFSFGSPDILPMFARGALPGKVDMESYSEEAEDFTADASNLDVWVLDRLSLLLQRGSHNSTLKAQLKAPSTVFFLHLLGLDTTGHTYKPKSVEYIGNLMTVDVIVSEAERMLNDFFADDKTAFVFTADHGMSNKGNHGDGEPDNTRTPLIAWGAGIRSSRKKDQRQDWRDTQRAEDDYYTHWGELDHIWREDVDQADIAPLMASLIGASMPANSEGILPLDYLDVRKERLAEASLANAEAILEIYRVKDEQRRSRMIRYVPFPRLDSEGDDLPGTRAVKDIQHLISIGSLDEALVACQDLAKLSLDGAKYLQTYDWLLLVSIVLTGYLGSIVYGLAFLIRKYVLVSEKKSKAQKIASMPHSGYLIVGSILALFIARFVMEDAPVTYYLYTSFAAYYWANILGDRNTFTLAWQRASNLQSSSSKPNKQDSSKLIVSITIRVLLSLIALEGMVYGYLERLAWTAGFIVLGLIWPAVGIAVDVKTRHELLILLWTLMCTMCGTLTLSGVEKEESVPYLIFSGLLFLSAGGAIATFPSTFLQNTDTTQDRGALKRMLRVLKILLATLLLTIVITARSSMRLQQKKGLPLINQALAWFILLFCLTMPFTYSIKSRRQGDNQLETSASYRLIIIIFSFAPIFILLSIRDEALFFGCYSLTLLLWTKLEGALYEERQYAKMINTGASGKHAIGRRLEKEDVRIAIFFLFFLHVGFFGTGNIASISSFYLSPVYRLVPIFSPFLMATLLLLKILTPFVILASTFQLLCLTKPHSRIDNVTPRKTGVQIAGPPLFGVDSVGGLGLQDAYSLVLLACISTDILAISFLIAVKTTGSWLEIGQTITHFAMANLLQVFMLALSAVADVIVGRGTGSHFKTEVANRK